MKPNFNAKKSMSEIRLHTSKCQANLRNISSILSDFDNELFSLEKDMLPIYQLTESLSGKQNNIDICIQEMREIGQNFAVSEEIEKMMQEEDIHENPDIYLKAILKLDDAILFLELHGEYKSSNQVLQETKETMKKIIFCCIEAFEYLVSQIHPDDIENTDICTANKMAKCLSSGNFTSTKYRQTYSKQRVALLKLVIQNSRGRSINIEDIDFLFQLFKNEKSLAARIFSFSREDSFSMFRSAIGPVLIEAIESIEKQLKAVSDESLFELFPLFDFIKERSPTIEEVLEFMPNEYKSRGDIFYEGAIIRCRSLCTFTAAFCINEMNKEVKKFLILTGQLSKNASVHRATSNMLNLCRRFLEYEAILNDIFQEDHNDAVENIAEFIEGMIRKLIQFLPALCSQIKYGHAFTNIFLLNNYHYIVDALTTKGLTHAFPSLETVLGDCNKMFESTKAQIVNSSYMTFAECCSDPKGPLLTKKGSSLLTLETGRFLKEKFTVFNALIEDLHKTHKSFIIPNEDLRHEIIDIAMSEVLGLYKQFFQKYSNVKFSKKNMSKYVKYTPLDVEVMLKEMYSGA